MDNAFKKDEKLYRAIYPPDVVAMFWKKDGTLSSAAFADPNGLSVDRGDYRSDDKVIASMQERFTGCIVSLYVKACVEIGAYVNYLPSKHNIYHSEIHGSQQERLLSKQQRKYLALKASVISK